MKVILHENPIGKPRMTQRDKWKQRDIVIAYRAWADLLRYKAFGKNKKIALQQPTRVLITAFFDSGRDHRCGPHSVRPDIDNIEKGVLDALFLNDQVIYRCVTQKFWCDGGRPRIEIEWYEDTPHNPQQKDATT